MSATFCSVRTINALATFASQHTINLCLSNGDILDAKRNPQAIADLLLAVNMAGNRARYPQSHIEPRVIQYQPADPADLAAVVILKTANYFNYQACECPNYYESDAAAMMREIIKNAIRELPGYSETPWGLDGPEPETVSAQTPKVKQTDILSLCFPTGPVAIDDTPQPITRQALTSMGPAAPKQQPTPTPQPKKQPKPQPKTNQQPNGPF